MIFLQLDNIEQRFGLTQLFVLKLLSLLIFIVLFQFEYIKFQGYQAIRSNSIDLIILNQMSKTLDSNNFDISLYMADSCKKIHSYSDEEKTTFQIDFIELEKRLAQAQSIQQRTCEQIVEFVDQNRQKFLEINKQLDRIQSKIKKSENILKLLCNRIDEYKSQYYMTELTIQKFINQYELRLIRSQLMKLAKSQATFLLKFNQQFQIITNKGIMELNLTQKYLIARFTYKLQFIKSLYEHHIIKQNMPESFEIADIVVNLGDQFEFYLGEQLAKYQSLALRSSNQSEKLKVEKILNQIRGWYVNLGKNQQYFKMIERNTIQKQMQIGQKLLLVNKTLLLSGKDSQLIESVFSKILAAVATFPKTYPKQRLKSQLFAFFKKEELKFLYTYAMPIFPLSYSCYFSAVQSSQMNEQIKEQLRKHHGWNLKMWMHVRAKNISDRSINDSDMLKWIDIIFKSACMLPGTISQFTKLTFKIVNRYLTKTIHQDFLESSFNRLVEQQNAVGIALKDKILSVNNQGQNIAQKIKESISRQFKQAIQAILRKNLNNICQSCQGSLQPPKSFVSKIIKKDKDFIQNNTINKMEIIFRPLDGFIKNNSELSKECVKVITEFVQKSLVKYYDSNYAPQILTYSKDHLIYEQTSLVMEVIGRERTTLFKIDQ